MKRRLLGCLAAILVVPSQSFAQQAPSSEVPAAKKPAAHPPKKPVPPRPPAGATAPDKSRTIPQPEVLLLLIRTTLIALDQANKTNNYTVLREIGGPSLQKFMSAQLGELFSDIRSRRIDLSPTVVVTPQMLEPPAILSNGMLRLIGYFPTQPLQINFELLFEEGEASWRVAGLRVSAALPGSTPSPTAPK